MVQFVKIISLILIGASLSLFLGCAQFVGGNLNELITDSSHRDLENYKFNPLPDSDNSLSGLPRNQFKPLGDDFDASDANIQDAAKETTEDLERPIIRLSPVGELDDSSNDFVGLPTRNQTLRTETPVNVAGRSAPLVPVAHTTNVENGQQLKRPEPFVPITTDIPVGPAQVQVTPLPSMDSTSNNDLDVFVSEQMKILGPPFAHHPETEQSDFSAEIGKLEANQTSRIGDQKFDSPASQVIPKFVDDLISQSMDPNSVQLVSNKTAASSKAYTKIVPTLTWSDQLNKTIKVFEAERQRVESDSRKLQLGNSLEILRTLKSNLAQAASPRQTTPAIRQYWLHQINALNAIMSEGDTADWQTTATTALHHLNEAAIPLREAAELKLNSAIFCRKVSGFGQYEPFSDQHFGPNQSVLVYCEIENFSPSEIAIDGGSAFETKISSSFWIEDLSGKVIQEMEFPAVSDHARKIRTDFFMHVPVQFIDLSPGDYRLQLKVNDFGSNKTATLVEPLSFTIR